MTVFALLSGKLQSAPESRTSKSDKPFVLFTLRVANGNELQFWKVFAFSETTQAELLALNEGDALSVQGVPRFEIYAPDGAAPRVSLSITADHIVRLRPLPSESRRHVGAI
jgi:hypothetical protein